MAQQPPVLNTYSLANPQHEFKITKKGSYSKDYADERNQYVGTWQYSQNGILFEVKMEKKDQHLFQTPYNYFYVDVILIRYRLIKNGVDIYNNYNSVDPEVLSEGTKQGGDDYLNCSFLDVTRQVLGDATVKKLSGTPEKILFNLSTGGYMLLGPPEIYQPGVDLFSIPTGPIEMLKIN
jgi:hypothetical protein